MIDLTVRDLTKTEDEDGAIDFIALTNPQWEMIKVNIDLLKNHEKCELMYVEDFLKILAKERADAIDECIKVVKSVGADEYTYNEMLYQMEQLKEQKNE